jgi:hypothetical protein
MKCENCKQLESQLIQVQAAIANARKGIEYTLLKNIDLSALDKHDAEVRKPLVAALVKLSALATRPVIEPDKSHWTGKLFCSSVKEICDDALAKAKES